MSVENEVRSLVAAGLYDDLRGRTVALRLVDALARRFKHRLSMLSSEAGFAPESASELKEGLAELFGETLRTLRATSIQSSHEELAVYKDYWEDSELGPFFKKLNVGLLRKHAHVERLYACDSMADAVAEDWFKRTAVEQARRGAQVKVVEISPTDLAQYEDFGLYEHKADERTETDNYLLLAPAELNRLRRGLNTTIVADEYVVRDYSRRFEQLWEDSGRDPLVLLASEAIDGARVRSATTHGTGSVNQLLDRQVILRQMKRLDTGNSLVADESVGFLRKYQARYAEAILKHVRECFPGQTSLTYVGDTYKNDGTLIRNLQARTGEGHGIREVTGFVCEPALGLERLWFNEILYSNSWHDLLGLAEKIEPTVGPSTLAIFDVDQTLWAPKGVRDEPLARTRTRAITRLIDRYVHDPSSAVAMSAKSRVDLLYNLFSHVKYHGLLTLDNEDYKAALCVFLSLNALWNQEALDVSDRAAGAQFFARLQARGPHGFRNYIRDLYLPPLLHHSPDGERNMTQFMLQTLAAVGTEQYGAYAALAGVVVESLRADVDEIFRKMVGPAPVKYLGFRVNELEEALALATSVGDLGDLLVLNKPVWDFAQWLKGRGAVLLGLSDRPDEATISATADRSLLEARMTIYGRGIADLLPA